LGSFNEWFAEAREVARERRVVLRHFRVDGARELVSGATRARLHELGVQLEVRAADAPNQQGAVEVEFRVLFNMVRSMMFAADAPHCLWGESVLHAVTLSNCVPFPARRKGGKVEACSPHRILHREHPPYHRLRVWGCDAFAHNQNPDGSLDERGQQVKYVGHDGPRAHAFRLYNPKSGQIIRRHHVVFNEGSVLRARPRAGSSTWDPLGMLEPEGPDFAELDRLENEDDLLLSRGEHELDIGAGPSATAQEERSGVRHAPATPDGAADENGGGLAGGLLGRDAADGLDMPAGPMDAPLGWDRGRSEDDSAPRRSGRARAAPDRLAFLAVRPAPGEGVLSMHFGSGGAAHSGGAAFQSATVGGEEHHLLPPGADIQVLDEAFRAIDSDLLPIGAGAHLMIGGEANWILPPTIHPERFVGDEPFREDIEHSMLSAAAEQLALTTGARVPSTYRESLRGPDAPKWAEARAKEIAALEKFKVWTVVDRPPTGVNICKLRWIFNIKSDGRYKARLVVRGFTQIQGIDYFETYAGVVRSESIRLSLALAAINKEHFIIYDFENAFLNAPMVETCYVHPPDGVQIQGLRPGQVLRLLKALYGTHQAARAFGAVRDDAHFQLGFHKSLADPCVYIRPPQNGEPAARSHAHTDDCAMYSKSRELCLRLVLAMHEILPLKYGHTELLGMDVLRGKDWEVILDQRRMVGDIITSLNAVNLKPNQVPLSKDVYKQLHRVPVDERLAPEETRQYASAVGKLLYPANKTRPDLSTAVCRLTRYMAYPGAPQMKALKQILRYLRRTQDYVLVYRRGPIKDIRRALVAFSDADFASDPDDRKSTTGFAIFLGLCLVAWASVKQGLNALSTPESEYMALAFCIQMVLHLRGLLEELGFGQEGPTIVYVDNISAMYIADGATKRSRFIDQRFHYIRDAITSGRITLIHVPSESNLADLFTKPLGSPEFQQIVAQLGLEPMATSGL